MIEQPMICLTVIDLFVVIALVAMAVALATMIYNLLRDRFLW